MKGHSCCVSFLSTPCHPLQESSWAAFLLLGESAGAICSYMTWTSVWRHGPASETPHCGASSLSDLMDPNAFLSLRILFWDIDMCSSDQEVTTNACTVTSLGDIGCQWRWMLSHTGSHGNRSSLRIKGVCGSQWRKEHKQMSHTKTQRGACLHFHRSNDLSTS